MKTNRLSKRSAAKKMYRLLALKLAKKFRLSRLQRPILFVGHQNHNLASCFTQREDFKTSIEIKNQEFFNPSSFILTEIPRIIPEAKSKRRQRQKKKFNLKKQNNKRKQQRKSRKINR